MNGRLIDDSMIAKAGSVGRGSCFRYRTVVLPTTMDDLPRIREDAQESFGDIVSKVERLFGPPYGKMARIIDAERDILEKSALIYDRARIDPAYCFVLASAYTTLVRVNGELEEIIAGLADSDADDEHLSGLGSELASQLDSIDGILVEA